MEFHGSPWNSLGTPSNSMELHGDSMELCGDSMELHGVPWRLHDTPWNSMKTPWNSMGLHGAPWRLHGIPCTFHGIPFDSMEFHSILWNSMEFHGIPWGYFTRVYLSYIHHVKILFKLTVLHYMEQINYCSHFFSNNKCWNFKPKISKQSAGKYSVIYKNSPEKMHFQNLGSEKIKSWHNWNVTHYTMQTMFVCMITQFSYKQTSLSNLTG